MPVAEKKGTKKQQKKKTAPVPPPLVNVTVRDCMYWPEPRTGKGGRGTNPNTTKSSDNYTTHVHFDEGLNGGSDNRRPMPLPPLGGVNRDSGTAIEALRGWPGKRMEENNDDVIRYEMEEEAVVKEPPKSGKNSKKKGKGHAPKDEEDPTFMSDIIQNRYLNEYLEKRRKEMEREQRRKEESKTAMKAGRLATLEKTNIKANRASQLRAIALAEQVETKPKELWKMPRFRNARPHLETTPGGRGKRDVCGNGSLGIDYCGGGGDGGCCCDNGYHSNYADLSEDEFRDVADPLCEPCCDSPIMATN